MVVVPRELLLACRGELRHATGHWIDGFTSDGNPIAHHDTRMPDGECLVCVLLGVLDFHLQRGPVPTVVPAPAGGVSVLLHTYEGGAV